MAEVRRLPVPLTEIWDWQMHSSCRGMNTELFFHPERERSPARVAREARAKTVCRGCLVLQECRGYPLAVHEPYEVWGGLSVDERNEQIRASTVIGRHTERYGRCSGRRTGPHGSTPVAIITVCETTRWLTRALQ